MTFDQFVELLHFIKPAWPAVASVFAALVAGYLPLLWLSYRFGKSSNRELKELADQVAKLQRTRADALQYELDRSRITELAAVSENQALAVQIKALQAEVAVLSSASKDVSALANLTDSANLELQSFREFRTALSAGVANYGC